jgi:hypothetical protein
MKNVPAINASPSFTEIDTPGVASVCLPNGKIQTIFCFGYGNQVNVIGHKTISPDLHVVCCAPFSHEFQVCQLVLVPKKCLIAPVAPLRYLMWNTRCYRSCYSCHFVCQSDNNDHCQSLSKVSPEVLNSIGNNGNILCF